MNEYQYLTFSSDYNTYRPEQTLVRDLLEHWPRRSGYLQNMVVPDILINSGRISPKTEYLGYQKSGYPATQYPVGYRILMMKLVLEQRPETK